MSRKLQLFLYAVLFGFGACQNQSVKPTAEFNKAKAMAQPSATPSTQPALGYLEHRGHQYSIRDLMDPAYRAASNDKFARDFNPDTMLVRERNMSAADMPQGPMMDRSTRAHP